MLKLYNRERSGNCYKVRLMLSLLGLEYEKIPVDRHGKGRNIVPEDYEQLSPLRQIPLLVADGVAYWGTIAILVYLARKYGGEQWLPADADGEAQVTQWLSLAQNEIFYGLGRARSMRGGRWHGYGTLTEAHEIAERALKVLEERLQGHPWLALDRVTIAERQAAEAVPFRLIGPAVAGRQLVDGFRFHRRELQRDRQIDHCAHGDAFLPAR